jgi:hypothetical protein
MDKKTLADAGTRRLIAGLGICWVALSLSASTLVALLGTAQHDQIVFAILYGFILSVAGTALISSLISVAAGATGGVIIGSVFTLAAVSALKNMGSVASMAQLLRHSTLEVAVAGGIPALVTLGAGTGAAISIGIGITGALTAEPAEKGIPKAVSRQIGAVLVGIVLSGLLDALVLKCLAMAQGLTGEAGLRITLGVLVAFLVFFAAALQQHSLKRMVGLATGFGALAVVATSLAARLPAESGLVLALSGVVTAILYSSLFTVAFLVSTHMAGPSSGAAASALGSGIPFVAFLAFGAGSAPGLFSVLISIVFICVGLMVPRLLYAVAYPFEMAWNLLLLRADQRRPKSTLLLRNAAFWDERQKLMLLGLDDHLLLTHERDPLLSARALDWLGHGPQAWAVHAVRIELCARALEACSNLASIGDAHRELPMLTSSGPEDPVQYFHNISRNIHAALQFENFYHRNAMLRTSYVQMNDLSLRGLPGTNGSRLLPVLSRWNQVVADAIVALAAQGHSHSEIDNPYVVGVPLTPEQRVFVGRIEVSSQISQALLGPQAPPLLLYGQRRMGKTSLLNNLGQILPDQILPLFVDLQGAVSLAEDLAGLLLAIGRAMVSSARRHRNIRLPELLPEALGSSLADSFDQWLDRVEAAVNGQIMLLALDEFEALEQSFRRDRLDETIVLGLIRHIIQHRRQFRVLIAASHSFEEFSWIAGYLINLQMVKIGYLAEDEARQLIEHPLRGFPLRYAPDATARVIGLTHGHPHLLQSLCYEIVKMKNEQGRERQLDVSVEDVEEAAEQALERGRMFFLDIAWSQLSAPARRMAKNIAQGVDEPSGQSDELHMLLSRDIVEQTTMGTRFQVELIRRWFDREMG